MTKTIKKTRKRRAAHKGVVTEISAAEGMSHQYAGNSALVDDAIDAQQAFDRADAWARSEVGTPYGSVTPTITRTR